MVASTAVLVKETLPSTENSMSSSVIHRKRQVSTGLSTCFAANIGRQGSVTERTRSDPSQKSQRSPRLGSLVSKLEAPLSPAQSNSIENSFVSGGVEGTDPFVLRRSSTTNIMAIKNANTNGKMTIDENFQSATRRDHSEYPKKRPSCFPATPKFSSSPSSSSMSDVEHDANSHSPTTTPSLCVQKTRITGTERNTILSNGENRSTQTTRTASGSVKAMIRKFERHSVPDSPCPAMAEKFGTAVTTSRASSNSIRIPSGSISSSPASPIMTKDTSTGDVGRSTMATTSPALMTTPSRASKIPNDSPTMKDKKKSIEVSDPSRANHTSVTISTEWVDFMRVGVETAKKAKEMRLALARKHVSGSSPKTSRSETSSTHHSDADEYLKDRIGCLSVKEPDTSRGMKNGPLERHTMVSKDAKVKDGVKTGTKYLRKEPSTEVDGKNSSAQSHETNEVWKGRLSDAECPETPETPKKDIENFATSENKKVPQGTEASKNLLTGKYSSKITDERLSELASTATTEEVPSHFAENPAVEVKRSTDKGTNRKKEYPAEETVEFFKRDLEEVRSF